MQTIEARAILSASDRTGGVFARVVAKIKAMNAAASRANAASSLVAARAGERASRASMAAASAQGAIVAGAGRVLAPAVAAGLVGKVYKNYAQADLAIRRIGITADASEAEVASLNKTMRDLSQETGKQFGEVTKGLASLTAGGMDLKDAMPALPAIVKTAQAAGAEVEDMATTTLALNQNLGVATDKMQNAFDILVKGGKAGKFELKDMARYFPSIAPAAVALGMKGEEGLMRIVAAMQTIRQGTGNTEEAAASMQNIFAKMESEETTKKFKEMGVDLRKEMKQARAEGKDLLSVFVELSDKALKGDLSKVPQLFSDMQVARGMRALLSYKDLNKRVMEELRVSAGSTAGDLAKVLNTPAIAMEKMKSSLERLMYATGFAIDQFGKHFHQGGTSGILNAAAKDLELAGEGTLRAKAIAEKEEMVRKYQLSSAEQVAGSWWHGNEGQGQLNKNTLQQQEARLKAFELRMAEGVGSELGKELFTKHELSRFPSYLGFGEGPEAPSKAVPMPSSDPRKGSGEFPPVQSLEGVTAELKGEAEVKGQAEVKVYVEAGSELLKIVENIKSLGMQLQGKLRANGPGSTGVSSPDASPAPSVGMGAP